MTRKARKESFTGLYHVVGCGNGRIFERQQDKMQLILQMEQARQKNEIEIFAYCVMEDHFHMLIRADLKVLSGYMHDLTGRYSLYFNGKKGRCGHVFGERYKSDCIEKETTFWNCVRYIHNNPIRAGKSVNIGQYPYSSAKEYLFRKGNLIHAAGKKAVQRYFHTRKAFLEFHQYPTEMIFADTAADLQKCKEEVLKNQIEKYLESNQMLLGEFLIDTKVRKSFVREAHEKTGLPFRQISDITGEICMEVGFLQNI